MKTEEFIKSRDFLEKLITENPENPNFLKSYEKLLELKSIYDKETDKAIIEKEIRQSEYFNKYQTSVYENNTKYNTSIYENDTKLNIARNKNYTEESINSQNTYANCQQHLQTQHTDVINNAINNGFNPFNQNNNLR